VRPIKILRHIKHVREERWGGGCPSWVSTSPQLNSRRGRFVVRPAACRKQVFEKSAVALGVGKSLSSVFVCRWDGKRRLMNGAAGSPAIRPGQRPCGCCWRWHCAPPTTSASATCAKKGSRVQLGRNRVEPMPQVTEVERVELYGKHTSRPGYHHGSSQGLTNRLFSVPPDSSAYQFETFRRHLGCPQWTPWTLGKDCRLGGGGSPAIDDRALRQAKGVWPSAFMIQCEKSQL
jgi:hypothetical protein